MKQVFVPEPVRDGKIISKVWFEWLVLGSECVLKYCDQ